MAGILLKKTEIQFELLTGLDMLPIIEKGIRGVCHTEHQYAKAYNQNKESYLIYMMDNVSKIACIQF